MTGVRRAANRSGPVGIRQVCRILGARFAGGDDGSVVRDAIPRGAGGRTKLGRWGRCTASVSPDLSN
jgi:hypothetical protein